MKKFTKAIIQDKVKDFEFTNRILTLLEIKDVRCWHKFEDIPFRYVQRDMESVVLYNAKKFIRKSMAGSKDLLCTPFNMFCPVSYCPQECIYCYCHNVFKFMPMVKIAANLPTDGLDQLMKFASDLTKETAVVVGELYDGTLFDKLLGLSTILSKVAIQHPLVKFIVQTKAKLEYVENYLKLPKEIVDNFIFVMSLNPQKIIKATELYTPSLQERLVCAKELQDYGYKIRLRIDPMFGDAHLPDYLGLGESANLYEDMFLQIRNRGIKFDKITLGTLRSFQGLFFVIDNYFPNNPISQIKNNNLKSSKVHGKKYLLDGRMEVYENAINSIKKIFGEDVNTSFCREQLHIFTTHNICPLDCTCKL